MYNEILFFNLFIQNVVFFETNKLKRPFRHRKNTFLKTLPTNKSWGIKLTFNLQKSVCNFEFLIKSYEQ